MDFLKGIFDWLLGGNKSSNDSGQQSGGQEASSSGGGGIGDIFSSIFKFLGKIFSFLFGGWFGGSSSDDQQQSTGTSQSTGGQGQGEQGQDQDRGGSRTLGGYAHQAGTWISNKWNDYTGTTKTRIQQATQFFQQQGWTKEQSAGIVANLVKESDLNVHATGDGGLAYGIGQWHPDRQANFRRWAGHDIRNSSFEEQLSFVNYELTKGDEQAAGNALRLASTAYQSGDVVTKKYERPANAAAVGRVRGTEAQAIYNSLGGDSGGIVLADNGVHVSQSSKPLSTPAVPKNAADLADLFARSNFPG